MARNPVCSKNSKSLKCEVNDKKFRAQWKRHVVSVNILLFQVWQCPLVPQAPIHLWSVFAWVFAFPSVQVFSLWGEERKRRVRGKGEKGKSADGRFAERNAVRFFSPLFACRSTFSCSGLGVRLAARPGLASPASWFALVRVLKGLWPGRPTPYCDLVDFALRAIVSLVPPNEVTIPEWKVVCCLASLRTAFQQDSLLYCRTRAFRGGVASGPAPREPRAWR